MSSTDAQVFAAAITLLQRDHASSRVTKAQALLKRKLPLRARFESAESQQKRVLDNAAAALAKLWKRSR